MTEIGRLIAEITDTLGILPSKQQHAEVAELLTAFEAKVRAAALEEAAKYGYKGRNPMPNETDRPFDPKPGIWSHPGPEVHKGTDRPQTFEQWQAGRNFKLSWYESCWDAAFRAGEMSRDAAFARIEEQDKMLARWKKAVEGLTPSGSEYVDDPEACAAWIRKRTNVPKIVMDLRAEIAALRQPMSCTHPKACWQATKPDSVDAVVGYRCVACEHERLVVAATLQAAADLADTREIIDSDIIADMIRKSIPTADAQALDAHDADTRNRALEEAAVIGDNYGREGDRLSQEYACETADEIASRIRALKREKRGGE